MKKRESNEPKNTKYIKYEETQLYKNGREVMQLATIEVSRMSKQYKYILGTGLISSVINIIINIARTYEENDDMQEKYAHIKELKDSIYKVIIILRTAFDVNAYNRTVYMDTVENLVNMYEQIKRWEISIRNNLSS